MLDKGGWRLVLLLYGKLRRGWKGKEKVESLGGPVGE